MTLFVSVCCIGLLGIPILLVIWLSFGASSYAVVPPSAYSLKWYSSVLNQPDFVSAFWVSLKIAAIVTPASLLLGTLAAFGIYKSNLPSMAVLQAALFSPLSVPLVVTGISLLYLFSHMSMHDYFWNIVIAHVIITFPYPIRTVLASLARYDRSLDEAAASLGAGPWRTFRYITFPLIRPGLFAGALFSFVMSFDDFTVTIFLIGPTTKTLPVAIYQFMEWSANPTVSAVSALLIIGAVVMMFFVERLVGLDRVMGMRG